MPEVGRLKDQAQNPSDSHGCLACAHSVIGPAVAGSEDVYVNGRNCLRVDDPGVHSSCCGANTWNAQAGSPDVYANGKKVHRKGDATKHCGGIGKLIEGSTNVYANGGGGGGGGGGGASSTAPQAKAMAANTATAPATQATQTAGAATQAGAGSALDAAATGAAGSTSQAATAAGSAASNLNVGDAVTHLQNAAGSSSSGQCAKFVRQAIEAGGVNLDPATRPLSAKDYGPYLENHGFSTVDMNNYTPQKGDVVVIQPYEGGNQHGHTAMYDGSQWVSDFKQKDMWGGPGYRKNQPSHQVYRP